MDIDIPPHSWWEIRYHVAMRAAYYLTVRIRQPHLRARVVEHVAACWLRTGSGNAHPDELEELFRDYCRDIERDVDPLAKDTTYELLRVWANHAAVLVGDVKMVRPRA